MENLARTCSPIANIPALTDCSSIFWATFCLLPPPVHLLSTILLTRSSFLAPSTKNSSKLVPAGPKADASRLSHLHPWLEWNASSSSTLPSCSQPASSASTPSPVSSQCQLQLPSLHSALGGEVYQQLILARCHSLGIQAGQPAGELPCQGKAHAL